LGTKPYKPLFTDEKESSQVLKKTFEALVNLLKSLTKMSHSFVQVNNSGLDLVLS